MRNRTDASPALTKVNCYSAAVFSSLTNCTEHALAQRHACLRGVGVWRRCDTGSLGGRQGQAPADSGGGRSCTIVNLVLIAAWLLFYESIDTDCARRAAPSAAICYFNCAPVGHRWNSLPAAVNVCSAVIRHAHEATGRFVSGG